MLQECVWQGKGNLSARPMNPPLYTSILPLPLFTNYLRGAVVLTFLCSAEPLDQGRRINPRLRFSSSSESQESRLTCLTSAFLGPPADSPSPGDISVMNSCTTSRLAAVLHWCASPPSNQTRVRPRSFKSRRRNLDDTVTTIPNGKQHSFHSTTVAAQAACEHIFFCGLRTSSDRMKAWFLHISSLTVVVGG